MRVCPTILGLIAIFSGLGSAQPTWPSSIDELEDVMFLNTGYKNRGFAAHITPCSFSEFGAGRQTAAEWLRIGFHDMATTNVFFEPHGGIDASIAYELNDGENVGAGFNTTLHTYAGFFNSRLPVSDLIALGVYSSVRGCGGPIVPIRGGRVDATAAGPLGVPQPQNGQGTFTNQFARMGFNVTDMIQMTACGHTLGGVHAGDFNNIVAPGTAPDDFQLFDTTPEFDNLIATRYISGNDTDALAVGISTASGRNSDFAVFTADKNVTLQAMTNAATFNSMCTSILQRMIETVPPTVNLSAVISPYEVKPSGLQLTLLSGGTQLTFSGDVRVRTTSRTVSSVQVVYTDRNGAAGGTISTTLSGTANGFDDSFSFYGFSVNIPATTSISSFTVVVNTVGGSTQTFSNNGAGFPVQDSVIVQTPQSCYANGNLTVVAAVRSSVTTALNVTVTQKIASTAGSPIVSPIPSLSTATLSMTKGATIGSYVIYSGSASVASVAGAKFGAVSGSSGDDFKDVSVVGAVCSPLGTSAPSSTSSSVVSTSSSSVLSSSSSSKLSSSSSVTSTSSSATSTPTLAHKQTVGAYTFQGCYTEGTGVRALTSASFYNYTAMTIEMCASDCSGYSYFGVEYGGECYCGNTLASTSTLAALSDCSFICPGNSYEYCGAGNRLEMYLLSTSASSSSSPVSSSTPKSSSASSVVSTTSFSSSKSSTVVSSSSSAKPSSTDSSSTVLSSASTSKSSSSSVMISSPSSKTSTSSTSASASPTLHIVKSAGLYNYFGCYTEGTNVRALGAASYPNDTNTIESCVAACSPYLYAGAEYGRECWCADSFGVGATLAPDSDCSMTCAGNQYEYCGAGNRLSVYIRNGTASSVSSTTTTSKVSSVASSSSSASSKPTSTSTSTKTTTVSPSSLAASSSSKPLSTLTTSTRTLTTTTSSSIFSSSSTASPTSTGPAIKTTLAPGGGWTYYGCRTEGTSSRALTGATVVNYNTMTLEICAADCEGYTYFGVEYGGECYCGFSWSAGSTNVTDGECSFACPGNSNEWCGAGNRLTSYVARIV
ncbi:related to beta-1,3 exoglucanase precursor [Phialocephala subalpina]|uniref:Related to beta-1,3 exoglucanase n=1 Tax=Phialocephala subalpina TaxID=576137 RepID=A0A1L7WX93_9HELO|nr:related to beta-1,3 exoglucanase precursor [Phialocephala subalpina]